LEKLAGLLRASANDAGNSDSVDSESDSDDEDDEETAALASGLPASPPVQTKSTQFSWRQRTIAQCLQLGWAPAGLPAGLIAQKCACLHFYRTAIGRALILGSVWAVETTVSRLLNTHHAILVEDVWDAHSLLPDFRAAMSEGLAALVALGTQRTGLVLACAIGGARAAEASAAAHFAAGRTKKAEAEWQLAIALCCYPAVGPGSSAGGSIGTLGAL